MADKTVAVRLVVRAGEFTRGMAQAGAATQQFSVQAEQGARRAASASKSLGVASMVSGKAILLGIGGAMAVSAQAAIEFESSLAGVAKTTNLAGPALAAMGEALRNVSTSRVPIDVNELGALAQIGGQLGIEIPNIVAFTEVIAKMGVSTNLAGEDAATGLARIANIMGTSQSEIENIASAMVDLGNNFATTEAEILTFALRLAPVGVTVGLTEANVLGLSTAMSSLGIPAERGGTALQRVFIRMKKAADAGASSMENYADVAGMTGEAFKELFDTDPGQAFQVFAKGLDEIAKSGGNVFVALERVGIVEQRTIATMLSAASGHELLADALDTSTTAYEENIALNEEAATRFETTASKIQFLKNSFNDLRIEIGNAILGSGGLQAAMFFMQEFFGVIQDNIGTLGKFSLVLGGIAVLKLASGFGTLAVRIAESAGAIRTSVTNLNQMTISARAGAIAMGTLNIAMNAVIGIGTILITAWAMQAQKAAELRGQVRMLNQEMENGVDPVDAYMNALGDDSPFTVENVRLLTALGIGARELSAAMLSGEGATDAMMRIFAEKNNIDDVADSWGEMGRVIDEAGLNDNLLGLGGGINTLVDLTRAFGDMQDLGEFTMGFKIEEVKSSFLDAQFMIGATTESLDAMAKKVIEVGGINITPEAAVALARQLAGQTDAMKIAFSGMSTTIKPELEAVAKSWQEMILNMEGGDDILERFFEAIPEAAGEFSDALGEDFEYVSGLVMGGAPGWEEYSSKVEVSLAKVEASFERYIADVEAWVGIQDTLLEHASSSTISWLDSQGPAVQAYLASLPEDELIGFIDRMDTRFDALTAQQNELWGVRMPGSITSNIPALATAIASAASTLGLEGEALAEAINTAIAGVVGQLPADQRAQVEEQLRTALASVDGYAAGNTLATDISDGFIAGLWAMDTEAARMAQRVANTLSSAMDHNFKMQSPSKLMEEKGQLVGQGFINGWKGAISPLVSLATPAKMMPSISTGNPSTHSSSVTNNRSSNITLDIAAGNRDLEREVMKGAVYMASVVSLVEGGAGK